MRSILIFATLLICQQCIGQFAHTKFAQGALQSDSVYKANHVRRLLMKSGKADDVDATFDREGRLTHFSLSLSGKQQISVLKETYVYNSFGLVDSIKFINFYSPTSPVLTDSIFKNPASLSITIYHYDSSRNKFSAVTTSKKGRIITSTEGTVKPYTEIQTYYDSISNKIWSATTEYNNKNALGYMKYVNLNKGDNSWGQNEVFYQNTYDKKGRIETSYWKSDAIVLHRDFFYNSNGLLKRNDWYWWTEKTSTTYSYEYY